MEDVDVGAPTVEQVYRDKHLALLRLTYLLLGSRQGAEDVVQTAFAAAQARWNELEEPVAYLRQVVVNQAKESHRRRYRFRSPSSPDPVTHQPDIDETWEQLRALPPRQRIVVVLRFYEDLPLIDIAHLLDRPEGTVRSDLHRALVHLRRILT